MWEKGTLLIDGTNVKYCVKHYGEPSEEYGIEGGCISKMELRIDGKVTLNYDRGWDMEPEDETSASLPTRFFWKNTTKQDGIRIFRKQSREGLLLSYFI